MKMRCNTSYFYMKHVYTCKNLVEFGQLEAEVYSCLFYIFINTYDIRNPKDGHYCKILLYCLKWKLN